MMATNSHGDSIRAMRVLGQLHIAPPDEMLTRFAFPESLRAHACYPADALTLDEF
jgi:hypothetical protein